VTLARAELIAHVEAAFTAGPASRDRLLAYAIGSHARPEVIELLRTLPDKPYATARDLWSEIACVPVGD
jgi:uncharacterized protein DUF2795